MRPSNPFFTSRTMVALTWPGVKPSFAAAIRVAAAAESPSPFAVRFGRGAGLVTGATGAVGFGRGAGFDTGATGAVGFGRGAGFDTGATGAGRSLGAKCTVGRLSAVGEPSTNASEIFFVD